MTDQQIARRQGRGQRLLTAPAPSLETVHLSLHETDQVTGDEDGLCALFYEYYRGYTIYSNEEGVCCIHGAGREGCLRLWGKYVSFPDIEAAKNLIKYFRAQGIRSGESMDRALPHGDVPIRVLNTPLPEPGVVERDGGTGGKLVRETDNTESGEIATSFPLRKKKTEGTFFGKMCYVTV